MCNLEIELSGTGVYDSSVYANGEYEVEFTADDVDLNVDVTFTGSEFEMYDIEIICIECPDTTVQVTEIPCDLPEGCYTICLYREVGEELIVEYCSQKLYVSDGCETSLVRYRNEEGAFGFVYPVGIYNQLRLPFLLKTPQTLSKKNLFSDAEGSEILLSAKLQDEYTLETDYADKDFHSAFAVMLAHDVFEIWNDKTQAWERFATADAYKVKWNEDNLFPLAMGNCKILGTPFDMRNNYCN